MSEGQRPDNPPEYVSMKIHPDIFEELGVRDPEQIKRETKIMKETRKIIKALKVEPDNLEMKIDLATLYVDGGNYEQAIKLQAAMS